MISSAMESNALLMRGAQVRSLHHPREPALSESKSMPGTNREVKQCFMRPEYVGKPFT